MSSLRQVVARGPRLSKWLHKDGSSAKHGLGYEYRNVYSISQLPRSSTIPSADIAPTVASPVSQSRASLPSREAVLEVTMMMMMTMKMLMISQTVAETEWP